MEMLNNPRRLPASTMTLCTLLASVLTACGGGSGATGAAADGGVAATNATEAVAGAEVTSAAGTEAAATAEALRVKKTPVSTVTTLAQEWGSFSVVGTQVVQFGADSRWIKKSITGAGECTNAFFGSDPALGTFKSCQLVGAAASVAPGLVAAPAPLVSTSPIIVAEPSPAPAAVAAPAPTPSGTTVTAWVRLALEGELFTTAGAQTLRYGDGQRWVSKVMTGQFACNGNSFGSDPAYGAAKYCEVQLTVPGVVQSGTAPVVNMALMPKAAVAFTSPRVRGLNAAELADLGWQPTPADIGAVREGCNFSHMAADDPIVYPNAPGASHMHTFFGNSLTSASSTGDSLMNSGGSTCAGGTVNRTAYWMPTLIDIRTGQPLVPVSTNFYYKQGYLGVKAGTMNLFPKGLRMIAGDSKNAQPITSPNTGLACVSGGGHQPAMPNCAVGDSINISVIFPQCWDGVNLDSPDHKSHMAYANGKGCPSTHPVALPEISLNTIYAVTEPNINLYWKLSSDNYTGTGGYSLHADWYNGWDTATNTTFLTRCLNVSMDCHQQALGDGTILY